MQFAAPFHCYTNERRKLWLDCRVLIVTKECICFYVGHVLNSVVLYLLNSLEENNLNAVTVVEILMTHNKYPEFSFNIPSQ